MTVHIYIAFWVVGACVGIALSARLLQMRAALSLKTVTGFLVTCVALLYATKVQSRFLSMPVIDAFLVAPDEWLHPGHRLPLGLLFGGFVGVVWVWLARGPWRTFGDALAISAAAMQAVGRIGCFLGGCCTGKVSDLPWSLRFDSTSDAHILHTAMNWIPTTAEYTLPVHPLQLYYALLNLGLLALFAVLLRHRAEPGSLMAAFALLDPPLRLGLEHLRGGYPWRDWSSMFHTIEVSILVNVSAFLLWCVWKYRHSIFERTAGRQLEFHSDV